MLRKNKTLLDQAAEVVESIKPHVEAAYESAKEAALPLLADGKALASEKAAAGAELAKERGPVLAAAAKEYAAAGAARAREAAEEHGPTVAAAAKEKAAAGRDAAVAKFSDVTGHPQPKRKKHRFLKALLLGGLAAGAVAAFKKKQSSGADTWQSSYVPSPAAKPAPSPAPASGGAHAAPDPAAPGNDAAAAEPSEAVSDAAAEPRQPTTPDDPAEVTPLSDAPPLGKSQDD